MSKEYTLEEFKKVWTAGTDAEMFNGYSDGRWTLIEFSKSLNSFPFAQGPWRFVNKDKETKTMTKKTRKHAKHSDVGNKTGVIPVGTVVWKKAYSADWATMPNRYVDGVYLVKMVVLKDGVVPYAACTNDIRANRKCRAPSVCVLGVYKYDSATGKLKDADPTVRVVSAHDWSTEWKPGTIVESGYWADDPDITCTSGIHFYRTLREAKRH